METKVWSYMRDEFRKPGDPYSIVPVVRKPPPPVKIGPGKPKDMKKHLKKKKSPSRKFTDNSTSTEYVFDEVFMKRSDIKMSDLTHSDKKKVIELIEEITNYEELCNKLEKKISHLKSIKKEQQTCLVEQAKLHLEEKNLYMKQIEELKKDVERYGKEIKDERQKWTKYIPYTEEQVTTMSNQLKVLFEEKENTKKQLSEEKDKLEEAMKSVQNLTTELDVLKSERPKLTHHQSSQTNFNQVVPIEHRSIYSMTSPRPKRNNCKKFEEELQKVILERNRLQAEEEIRKLKSFHALPKKTQQQIEDEQPQRNHKSVTAIRVTGKEEINERYERLEMEKCGDTNEEYSSDATNERDVTQELKTLQKVLYTNFVKENLERCSSEIRLQKQYVIKESLPNLLDNIVTREINLTQMKNVQSATLSEEVLKELLQEEQEDTDALDFEDRSPLMTDEERQEEILLRQLFYPQYKPEECLDPLLLLVSVK